ncbi:MAG: STAS domain-containing protein [Candidatus Omnitrophica bacterium]|nr:STAS domain-containing protein [Candidatus Omnitrophota bacterium]
MEIKDEKSHDVLICVPKGEINIHNAVELRKAFSRIIQADEKKVVVDFSFVSFIDSVGLATLIEMLLRLQQIDGHFKLSNMITSIKDLFETTRLDTFFEIYDTRENAVKDFQHD